MEISQLTDLPPRRQLELKFGPPVLQDLDPSERRHTIACLARMLMEASDIARKEDGDEGT